MQPEEETKNMKKRLLAMLMVLSMALSILPMSAVAVGNGEAREYQDQIVKQGEEIVTSEGKVKHSKIIQQTGENTFDITLQVKTSEEIKEQVVSEDAAVVLVLDQSSSMTYNNIKDLKKAVYGFVDTLTENVSATARREIAIVMFGSNADTELFWTNAVTDRWKVNQAVTGIEKTSNEGTNIEGGLRLANNLLNHDKIKDIQNKYVILMTDGVPTFHVTDRNETSSMMKMTGSRGGGSSAEHLDWHDIYCTKGWDDLGESDDIPGQIREKGAKLYTVSYKSGSIENKKVNGQTIDNWLGSFADQHFQSNDDISLGLENIAQIIVNQAKAWILTDPMGEYIQFGLNEGITRVTNETQNIVRNPRKYNTDTNTLIWDLKNDSLYEKETIGNVTWYTYTLTYSVTLNNLKEGFSQNQNYDTNGTTKLTYMVRDGKGDLEPELYETELAVPQVKGFVGSLEFTKVNAEKQPLKGAEFTLKVDDGNWQKKVASDNDGKISFTDIPSGHVYTLTETEAPEGYVAVEPIDVTVSYGEVTAKEITDGTLIDPVATGSLAISKTVTVGDGLTPSPDTNFTFSVQFGSELSGTYETKTTSEKGAQEEKTGELTVTNGQATVTLQADQTITIQGLPAGTTYTVTETELGDGFTQTAPEGAATGTISADGTKTAAFTNTYEVESASLTGSTALQVKKEIQGKAPETSYEWQENDSFTFTITAVTQGAPMPDRKEIVIDKDTTNHTASFGDITYTKPGTYKYEIREKNSEIPGMSSDSRAYQVQVVVKDTGTGSLNVEKIMYSLLAGGSTTKYEYNENNPMTFVNTYDTATQRVIIRGTKTLTGDTLAKDQFSFALTKAEKVGSEGATVPLPVIDENSLEVGNTVKNTEATANNIFFGTITYDVQDAGTYKYSFQEVVPEDKEPGMVYDEEEKVVTVTVTYDEDKGLNAIVSVDAGDGTVTEENASLTFRNVKKEATLGGDGSTALTVNKTLTGRGWLPTDTFSFTLAANNDETKKAIAEGNVVLNGAQVDDDVMTTTISGGPTLTGSNSIMNAKTSAFEGITFYEKGTYKFLVQETAGVIEDVTYSQAAYTVTVQVDENEDGTLAKPEVTVTQTTNDKGDAVSEVGATTLQFTNTVAEKGNTKSVTTGTTEDPDGIDPDGKVAGVGDILTYTIQWVNDAVDENGNATAATVIVTDTIPEGTECVADGGANYDDTAKTLTWTIDNAAANATGEVSFRVKVTEAAVKDDENNTIVNQADVKVGNNDPKQTTTTETYVPEKSVTKYQPKDGDATTEVPQTGLKVGDQLTYTISYKNTEDTEATVTITDKVPTGTEFVSADNDGALNKESGIVTWTLNKVQPGDTGEVTMTVKVVSGAEATVENTASVQIGQDGPTVSTNTESTKIDESERTVTITPADIIVYTGGDGYESVVGNQSGAARAGDDEETGDQSNGLPEPGYYITLPDWLNDQLNIQDDPTEEGATDLSKILTFTYADEEQTREWSLALYYDDEDGTSYEETTVGDVTRNRYVYRMNPAVVGGEKIPVRVQFTPKGEEGGIPTLSDDFTLDLGTLYQQYDMTIYPGLLEQDLVEAQVKLNGGDNTETLPVKVGNGTLTVRGTTNGEVTTKVATTTDDVTKNTKTIDETTGCTITAVADADTQYVVNESHVTVEAESVHLLADELSQGDTAEGDAANESQRILKDYLVENNQAETDDHYIYQYLDLVDETNGRAWVTADRPVDVYWKLPKGSDSNDDFKIVHFTGLDRQYDEETEKLIGTEGYEVEEYTTANNKLEIVTLDGEQYLKFATKEFSPFVLVWDEVSNSSGGGGGGGNKPSLNTEDHYGYIVGYPVDYETGEPTDDQARKPVKPQGKITRAEVATIFFRMLTDESRNAYWSQSNSFTD
ncbi:Spy0128 family protein, partial [Evtepia gabavorous]|uniref:Spy0128 family protein n=1 Tax=Evtepia gabavorous TaxID=2211183 RepID=UPI003AF08001